jgi:hypothetical protein
LRINGAKWRFGQGIQVIFMKMIPSESRLDSSSASTYRSLWFGSRPRKDKPKELGGDGRPVVGVLGPEARIATSSA